MEKGPSSTLKEELIAKFQEDSSSIFRNMNRILVTLERVPDNIDLIHDAFREVHSLKSEAAYLQFDVIAQRAHMLESELDSIRKKEKIVDSRLIGEFFKKVDELQMLAENVTPPVVKKKPDDNRAADIDEAAGGEVFDSFENRLLDEARDRGELFYRIHCEIDRQSPMKIPRLFLLISNLELEANVIKVDPTPDRMAEDDHEITIFLTSALGEHELNNLLNVDEIERTSITVLRYDSRDIELPKKSPPLLSDVSTEKEPSLIRVETNRIDDLVSHVDELQHKIFNLERTGRMEKDIEEIKTLISNLESILRTVRNVPVKQSFRGLDRFVRDLCMDTGKTVELMTIAGEMHVDREVSEMITEVLVHLVRNAVDHGIEEAEHRAGSNKPEKGCILVHAAQRIQSVVLQVIDDGRGIDPTVIHEKVNSRSQETGWTDTNNRNLIDVLSEPGFSTKGEITATSGRGVGLDIVNKKIKKVEGASFRLVTRPGQGSVFTIEMPKDIRMMEVVLVFAHKRTLAIPKKRIIDSAPLDRTQVHTGRNGELYYRGYPVYSDKGRVFSKEPAPEEQYVLFLQAADKQYCLFVDDILFEKEIPESQFYLGKEISPDVYSVYIKNRQADFYFFDPTFA